jgi:predicted peptidase
MKRVLSLLLCTLMLSMFFCSAFALSASAEESVAILSYDQVEKRFNASKNSVTAVFKSSEGTSLPYRMYVPKDYDPNKSYPVVLYFHGAGERGNDNTHIFRGGSILQRLLTPTELSTHPCIIIAPQCAASSQWVLSPWDPGTYDHTKIKKSPYMTAAEELLDDVIKNYSVDESRLYVSGISMGGFGTWDLISRNHEKFAAAIPVCGGTDASYLENLKGFPIRTFHAADDPIVNCAGTVKANEILKGTGDFLYTEYSTGGHLIWDRAYSTAGLTDWLFAQKNENVKPDEQPSDTPSETPTEPSETPSEESESVVTSPSAPADDATEESNGFFDSIAKFFENIFEAIMNFFEDLFGGSSEE